MKSFMAYLRTFLLCFGMLHLSMLPSYALAEENENNSTSQEQQQRQQVTRVETEQGEDATTGVGQDLIDFVTMIGIGLLAKSLFIYTPITTDMMIASAGGAAYLYGEIAALDATKDKMESETFVLTKNEDGSTNNMQRDALEKQKKSYEDLAEMLDTKASMKKTAATAFLTAAAAALISQAKLVSTSGVCITAVEAEASTRSAFDGGACVGGAAVFVAEETSYVTIEGAPQPSLSKALEMKTIDKTQMVTLKSACQASLSVCTPRSFLREITTSLTELSMGTAFIVSGVGALFLDQMGIGPLGGLIVAVFSNLFPFHDTMMANPGWRATSYTVLSGLSFQSAKTTEEQADKMRENAETIQGMLNKFDGLGDSGVANLENETEQTEIDNDLEPSEDFEVAGASDELVCEPNCESQEVLIEDSLKKDERNGFGKPGLVVKNGIEAGRQLDERRNGKFDNIDLSGGVSENRKALRRLNRRVKDKINDFRKKKGQEPIDFAAREKKVADGYKDAVLKALDENPDKTSRAIAAFRSQLPESLDEEKKEEVASKPEESKNVAKKDSEAFKMPDIDTEEFSMDFDDEPKEASVSFGDDGKATVDVDENLNTDGNDIVSNKDVSIFKVISVRYMKSGIPRLIDLE